MCVLWALEVAKFRSRAAGYTQRILPNGREVSLDLALQNDQSRSDVTKVDVLVELH